MVCALQARVVTALVLTGSVWVLAQNAPDIKTLKEEANAAHDSLLHYIVSKHTGNAWQERFCTANLGLCKISSLSHAVTSTLIIPPPILPSAGLHVQPQSELDYKWH